MIIGWIVTQLTTFITWVIAGIPAPAVPSWMSAISSDIASVVDFINKLSSWIPSSLLMAVITAYVGVFAIAIGIRVTRIIASFFTGGGGSVA